MPVWQALAVDGDISHIGTRGLSYGAQMRFNCFERDHRGVGRYLALGFVRVNSRTDRGITPCVTTEARERLLLQLNLFVVFGNRR